MAWVAPVILAVVRSKRILCSACRSAKSHVEVVQHPLPDGCDWLSVKRPTARPTSCGPARWCTRSVERCRVNRQDDDQLRLSYNSHQEFVRHGGEVVIGEDVGAVLGRRGLDAHRMTERRYGSQHRRRRGDSGRERPT